MADSLGTEESDYDKLMDLIAGRGVWWFLGGAGFHTYPQSQPHNHAALLELERRGRVVRFIDEPDHCCFRPSEKELRANG